MNQIKRIHSYVASLMEESRLSERQESLLLLSQTDAVGGDNTGIAGCYNYVAASCANQTNNKCSNYGVCGNAINEYECRNFEKPNTNIIGSACGVV